MRPGAHLLLDLLLDLLPRVPPQRKLDHARRDEWTQAGSTLLLNVDGARVKAKRDWRARRELEVLSVPSFCAQCWVFTILSRMAHGP